MITFLDENDVEYGALATIKATNAVNGERSITGTIVSGDYVLSNIERGWRLRFDDEYFVVTYAKPVDEGRDVQVEFDAVHQFFWDFDKSSVYDQLADGSHTFVAYLDFIFKNSGYSYTVDSALNVHAFEKQSFGFKKRLTLFNDIITSTGVEFQVNGKVVRILEKVGTDLSTVVRKNFNMNELTIEKNIGDFVTYQKGLGAYFDEEDHSKGRLEVEYTSPLASVYGKLEAEPFVDERYSQSSSLLAVLKENVDNSYTISVSLDMEDLTRAGYKYKQPVAGDYIMAINETLDFQEKIRIVSFTSEYDVDGQLIKHAVTCNDIGSVKKLSAGYNLTKKQASSASATANNAYSVANKALISADGKNTNYYGDTFPVDNPKGTLKKGDLLFLTVGDTVKQYYWNGADWVINPVLDDVEAFKEQIAEELKDVPNREEFENKIAEELATSKAEIETQIETAKTQAESNAKEYADTINQETAKVAELANVAAGEIKADLVNVKNNLTSTSLVANNAQAAVDAAKQELTEVASELNTAKQDLTNSVAEVNTKVNSAKAELTQAKQDLMSQAQQLQAQGNAQTELTKRVTTVETTANGTKTTVSELSKTVDGNTKNITSVTNRTKTVEDDLANTKTTLTQVQTTANSASQKTATLESGLDGLTAKFNNLSVGGANLFKGSRDFSASDWINNDNGAYAEDYKGVKIFKTQGMWNGRSQYFEVKTGEEYVFSAYVKSSAKSDGVNFYLAHESKQPMASGLVSSDSVSGQNNIYFELTDKYQRIAIKIKITKDGWMMPRLERGNNDAYLFFGGYKLERGNIATDYSPSEVDLEQKVAEYRQNADQNYASLQSNLQTLDGTVKQNKSEFDQTASQIKSSISAVEGKIPTNLDSLNLMTGTRDWSTKTNAWHMGANWSTESEEYQGLKVHSTQKGWNGSHQNIFVKNGDVVTFSFFAKATNTLPRIAIKSTWSDSSVYQAPLAGVKESDEEITVTNEWKRYSKTVHITSDGSLQFRTEYNDATTPDGNTFYVAGLKVAKSALDTGYSENPIDAASDITKLNTTLTQTADGLKQLSTQVTSQGSTITSHTNSINSLTTGLSAKVSQSEFNTLSGRVTNAENNITAKANELSSKITSVEGKIPTSVGGRNLLVKTNQGKTNWSWNISSGGTTAEDYDVGGVKAVKLSRTTNASVSWDYIRYDGLLRNLVEPNTQYTLSFDVKPSVDVTFTVALMQGDWSGPFTDIATMNKATANQWTKVSCVLTSKATLPDALEQVVHLNGMPITSGNWLIIKNIKLEKGAVSSDWSPAPEDAIEEISSLSSELKQTKDGITLLATKTELNTAKSELQSGINTATNKANSAQSTANSNAQAISTHTTQISALNTGLSAKVSQSDFNTLSGRVTTAENNIIAKANELSSKITSVEGKIPNEIGAVNLFKGSRDFSGSWMNNSNGAYAEDYKGVKIFKTQSAWNGRSQYFEVKTGEEYMFSAYVKSSAKTDGVNFYLDHESKQPMASGLVSSGSVSGQNSIYFELTDKYQRIAIKIKITKDGWIMPRFERGNTNAYLFFGGYKLERGNVATDWSPAPEDTVNQISSLSSEFKQTTDAIKASVSSLDKSTVKSSSLTINADGIVMKAGKSTTDVANAIGSYFSVNQNAINLFSDKINVKGNMIVNGAITSDKIASKSINTAHLNGKIITADVISSNAVTADAIKAGAVTTDKMSANSINGDRIAAGTLDAAKIKAGSITASQIASGTITSNQIKAGGISSANIAAGAITGDKIAAGAIDANKIAANAITANMIRGGQLNSTNGATVFDLNAGTLTFNNNYGYIQRVASDKVFEITTWLHSADASSPEYLNSAFKIRKSDNSRQAGAKFTLNNTIENKPTATAIINADSLILSDSQNRTVLSIFSKGNFGNINMQGWGDIPVAQLYNCGLVVKDIGIGGHTKSLLNIVEELCKKANIPWV